MGKTLRAAIPAGYHRAFRTILDANITTLIAAVLLFKFGTGPVQGFAITLTIGILASLFTAIVVTRTIFDTLVEQMDLGRLRMMQFFPAMNFNFIGKRKFCYVASALVVVIGLAVFSMRGEDNYGVDFAGGTLQQLRFSEPVSVDGVRQSLKEIGLGNASIQQYGNPREVLIQTEAESTKIIKDKLGKDYRDNRFEVLRVEMVGPTVGRNLRKNAAFALFYGILGILAYVMFRFNLKYALAGVVALLHDVFIAIGVLALFHRQFDLTIVAALLTIAGYSINDTIVIYARIRENIRLVRKTTFKDIVNLSINQTFSRTILTSVTTLLVVISLLLRGGEVLSGFALALFIGFISGTYSTIYIASPLIITWQKRRLGKR